MISAQLKILGHKRRLDILSLLSGHELTVSQIAKMTALRQSAVSQHLALLRSHHFVIASNLGKEAYYTLDKNTLDLFLNDLQAILSKRSPNEPTVIDPICGMSLTPHQASYTAEYGGVRHYFCGRGCLKQFSSLHKGAK